MRPLAVVIVTPPEVGTDRWAVRLLADGLGINVIHSTAAEGPAVRPYHLWLDSALMRALALVILVGLTSTLRPDGRN